MQVQSSFWQKQVFWGIRRWELAAFAGFHVFLAILYFLAIFLTVSQQQKIGIAVNHLYKVIITAPFWWLFFRRLRHWPLAAKALLHLPLSAAFVALWLAVFYYTADLAGFGRMQGAGIWWDVYIPLLQYFIQFGIFHAYAYWTETIQHKEKEKMLLQLAHTAELNTLKAQIQPHFLFNTLNSISASIPASEEHSRRLIARLADVFRFAMNQTDKEVVALQKELEFIQNFLALEQQRFGDRLTVSYEVDVQLANYPLPPMLLQPLVENAIKHGIGKSVEGGHISLRIQQKENVVCFQIADTGSGINGTPQEQLFCKGIGLENTRQRLKRLFGADLLLSPNSPRGLCVQFHLPIEKQTPWK